MKNKKDKEIISLTYDFMFSEIFNKVENLGVLEYFLKDYLGIPYEEIKGNLKLVPRRLPNQSKKEARKEVDVVVKYNDNHFILEMNSNGFKISKRNRNLIYVASILTREYKKGDTKIKNIHDILEINFTTVSSYFEHHQLERLINEFELREIHNPEIRFTKVLKIDVIDMSKIDNPCYTYIDEREERIAKWCKILAADTLEKIENEGEEVMDNNTLDKLVEDMDTLSKDEDFIIRKEQSANYLESLKQEIEEDVHDEIEEKYYIGLNEGHASGLAEGQSIIIKNMLAKNITPEEIETITGISIEEQHRLLSPDDN